MTMEKGGGIQYITSLLSFTIQVLPPVITPSGQMHDVTESTEEFFPLDNAKQVRLRLHEFQKTYIRLISLCSVSLLPGHLLLE